MIETIGDIWNHHGSGKWIVITTNGYVTRVGNCVMGRGTALQASKRFPNLPKELGDKIAVNGNHSYTFAKYRIITFPVKRNWYEAAAPHLIQRSVDELIANADALHLTEVYMPRPGCGNGGLRWDAVRPLLEPLDGRFRVVNLA